MSEKEIKDLKKQIKKLTDKNSSYTNSQKVINKLENKLKHLDKKKELKRFYEIKNKKTNFDERYNTEMFEKVKNQIKKDPFAESNESFFFRPIFEKEKDRKYNYILKLTERQVRNIGKEKKVFLEFAPKKSFMFLLNKKQINQIEEAKKNKKKLN